MSAMSKAMCGKDRWYHRKMAWLDQHGLQPVEEWPLFGIEKVRSHAGPIWVQLTCLPPLDKHPDGLRRLLGEMRRLEHRLESEGIAGWIQPITIGNWKMRQWTEMIGATLYAEHNGDWFFKKEVDYASLPKSIREMVMRYGGHHHGAA